MNPWKQRLASAVTLANGACGVLAIVQIGIGLALQEGEDLRQAKHLQMAAWLVVAGMGFDALDGFVARALRSTSSYGALLDSFCDLMSFGVAPAFLVFATAWRPDFLATYWHERILLTTAVVYALCALLRLARFTMGTTPDEESHRSFQGLPSPAAAGVVVGTVLIAPLLPESQVSPAGSVFRAAVLAATLGAAILMVSRVRYPHLINRMLKGSSRLLLIASAIVFAAATVLFQGGALSIAFWSYAIFGAIAGAIHGGRKVAARPS